MPIFRLEINIKTLLQPFVHVIPVKKLRDFQAFTILIFSKFKSATYSVLPVAKELRHIKCMKSENEKDLTFN